MSASPLVKIAAATAQEVCRAMRLRDEAMPHLAGHPTPLQFLDRLVAQQETYPDAVDFLAHALPRREGIWWGCLCYWLAFGPDLEPEPLAALTAAVRWVLEPSEEHRRAVEEPMNQADPNSAIGSLAAAVFQSGGSLLPPDLPVVEPPPALCAESLSCAIHYTALTGEPDQFMPSYRRYVALGIGVALGKHMWQLPRATPRAERPIWPGQTR